MRIFGLLALLFVPLLPLLDLRSEMRQDRIIRKNMKIVWTNKKTQTSPPRGAAHSSRKSNRSSPHVASKQGNNEEGTRPSLFFVCIHTAIPSCALNHLYSEQSLPVSALPVSLPLHRRPMPSRYHCQMPTILPYLRLHRHLVNAPAIKYHH